MEEKTKVALAALGCVTGLQIIAWNFGYDGTVSQVVGAVYGAIMGFYFATKTNNSTN